MFQNIHLCNLCFIDDTLLFETVRTGNLIELIVTEAFTADYLKEKTSFPFQLRARLADTTDGFTAIILNTPKRPEPLYFEDSLYKGSISNDLKLTVPEIKLTENVVGATFELINSEKIIFTIFFFQKCYILTYFFNRLRY